MTLTKLKRDLLEANKLRRTMQLYFELAGEALIIKIDKHNLFFGTTTDGNLTFAPFEGLKLSKEGIIKEFPDLVDKELGEMRAEATKRFKQHIKELDTLDNIKSYIIKEFTNMGYKLNMIQRDGFRPVRVK